MVFCKFLEILFVLIKILMGDGGLIILVISY